MKGRLWRGELIVVVAGNRLAKQVAAATTAFNNEAPPSPCRICLAVEMGLLVVVAAGKIYLDYWGPYGTLTNRGKSTQELLHQTSTASEPGEALSR